MVAKEGLLEQVQRSTCSEGESEEIGPGDSDYKVMKFVDRRNMGASATLKLRRPSSADRERETMGTALKRYHLPSADCRERMNTGAALKRRRGRSSGEWETENVGAYSKRRRHCSSAGSVFVYPGQLINMCITLLA
ncbi:unnamed protein product [Malus baccata var. baccata]